MPKNKINISRSEFVEKTLFLNGQPFSLADYPQLVTIYNDDSKDICLKFSRQASKSTTLAMLSVARCAMIPYFKILYVSPTVDQTKVFSRERVEPVMQSPIIQNYYMSSSLTTNVFMKQLLNGSRMYLRYALLNASRLRGYSSDMNLFDESQDLRPEIIPIVQETKSRSLHKLTLYAGTPRRSRGTLADIWGRSSMNEFALKCPSCNHWNILDEKNIGPTWIICRKCAADLNPQKGRWVSSYSITQAPELSGYRLSALHFTGAPWIDWSADILLKQKNYPKAQFHNEVLALEYDEGASPITKPQLQVLCNPEKPMLKEPSGIDMSYTNILAVDYGPAASTKSNTVAVVLQRRLDKYHVLYAKKFTGHEADFAFLHDEIPRLFTVWNSAFIAADHGLGEATNSELRKRTSFEKIIAFQHEASQREKVLWNKKLLAYTLNRTQTMSDIFSLLKNGKIEFPAWQDMEIFFDDVLNIQSEFDEQLGRMRYVNIGPDDFFHALLYGIFLCDFVEGNSLISS